MTFAAALTAMEALNWSGVSLNIRLWSQPVQAVYPADLPCVVTELGTGEPALQSVAVDASKGQASAYIFQALLLSPITIRPANPFTYLDAYLGLWVGNLTLGGALAEPISFQAFRSGAYQYAGQSYFALGFLQKWTCEVS